MTDTVIHYNCKGARGAEAARAVARLLATRPELLVVLETAGARRAILRAARAAGYRMPITGTGFEGASTWILVRRDVKLRRTALVVTRRVWRGPKGRRRVGRALPIAVVELDRAWVRVIGVHQVWNPSLNQAAQDEIISRLTQAAGETTPALLPGDWNRSHQATGYGTPAALANRIDGYLVTVPGARIDFAIARGLVVNADQGPHYGSDHPSISYRIHHVIKEAD